MTSIRRTHRALFTGTLAAGLALGMAGGASAADLAPVKVSIDGGTSKISLDVENTSESFIPKGGQPTTEEPEGEPNVGDAFAFANKLTQGGTLVGTDDGRCTILSEEQFRCEATLTFADGTVRVAGNLTESEEAEGDEDEVPIVGGTGAYDGIKGNFLVREVDDKHDAYTLTYTKGGSGQVTNVPAGGVALGGAADSNTQTALFGLGVVAVAVGAGVFGASLVTARRRG